MINVGFVFVEGWYCYFFVHIIEKVMYGERTRMICVGQSDVSVK